MKKLLKTASVLFLAALVLVGAGFFMAKKDGVGAASVYGVIEENLKLTERNFEYTPPQKTDLTSAHDVSHENSFECGLNEFNTLSLFSDSCTVEFTAAPDETISFEMNGGSLVCAVVGGVLHVQAQGGQKSGLLSISIPDSCKGGFVINAVDSTIGMESLDSAMDIEINLERSKLESASLSADNISVMVSGSHFGCRELSSKDVIKISGDSSDIKARNLFAQSSAVTINNSSAAIEGITSPLAASSRMSTLTLAFSKITGGVSLDVDTGSAELKLPNSGNYTLRHDERYGLFSDKTKSAQNSGENNPAPYTIETNIKFGLVTAEN